jgi:putative FmdB family regulatory protein
MPIFEYQCSSCNERFEKITGKPAETCKCPKCGAESPRAVSAPSSIGDPMLDSNCNTSGFG